MILVSGMKPNNVFETKVSGCNKAQAAETNCRGVDREKQKCISGSTFAMCANEKIDTMHALIPKCNFAFRDQRCGKCNRSPRLKPRNSLPGNLNCIFLKFI